MDITNSESDWFFLTAEEHGVLFTVAMPDGNQLQPPRTNIGSLLLVGDLDPIVGSAGPSSFASQLADYLAKAQAVVLQTGLDSFKKTFRDAAYRARIDRSGVVLIQTSRSVRQEWLNFIARVAPRLKSPNSTASTLWLTPDPPDSRNRHWRRAAGRTEHRRTTTA
jgi:hypothetical protein